LGWQKVKVIYTPALHPYRLTMVMLYRNLDFVVLQFDSSFFNDVGIIAEGIPKLVEMDLCVRLVIPSQSLPCGTSLGNQKRRAMQS
jgi:hypothetical protein